ncbi:proline dehydrogenase family protein [Paenibacillus allorhizosphaerae]|uniref:Proline dehydrogenase 1 n=1 Tax=Paenibacillus allorhizosphaerae TaxID=2849866 RepID=A0ABN7TCD7_9BACL|nr:proline dehydrogenase family protein [Paenibacillus allorhizosphaerae]CAG7622047.1 Proline dehydrogenase 1 [Paenibacillus allorhizosphaerae]
MDLGTKLFRRALLLLAGNRVAAAAAQRYGLKLGAKRFVAGLTREEALKEIAGLNRKGISVTVDHLGEGIRELTEAKVFADEYVRLLADVHENRVDAGVSLKPTQMGLALDPETTYEHIRGIVRQANAHHLFVCIDMENSPYTDATIAIVRKLQAEGLTGVGTVIQAYLRRSMNDCRRLTKERVVLRLVKGAYKEADSIAYPRKQEVDDHFKKLIEHRLDSGVFTAIATHDPAIIDWTCAYAAKKGIARSAYEFQMLYGVASTLQERLALEGYGVRCYVPYGRSWYPYFVRRLAERPANVWFILKNW